MARKYQTYTPVEEFLMIMEEDHRCYDVLREVRFPIGFICPRCSCHKGYWLRHDYTYQCKDCRYQCSLTAGTIFHGTHVPLRKWFSAIYYVASSQGGISARALQRLILVSYKTALKMLRKIRRAMADANEKRFYNALFFKIKHLLKPKGISIAQSAIFVQMEPNVPLKVIFKPVQTADGVGVDQKADQNDPAIKTAVASAFTHLTRFFLGTYHNFCPKYFPLYIAEFVYKFNEPNPMTMIWKLLSDCIGVPFDEESVVLRDG